MRKRGVALAAGLAVLGLLTACGDASPSAPAARRPLYFDVKGLVEKQIAQLAQRQAVVTKRVSLRDQPTEIVRVPAVKWADELQIFFQADINKAALRGAYVVDSVVMPGGLLRRTYIRRPGQPNAPVARLTVVQQNGTPVDIAATINQDNPLFSAQKQLQMQLSDGKLRAYKVLGTQKLVLFDTLRYSAAGRVE